MSVRRFLADLHLHMWMALFQKGISTKGVVSRSSVTSRYIYLPDNGGVIRLSDHANTHDNYAYQIIVLPGDDFKEKRQEAMRLVERLVADIPEGVAA